MKAAELTHLTNSNEKGAKWANSQREKCTAFDLHYRIGKINALQGEFFHTVIWHVSSKTLKFAKAIELIKVHYCMAKL